MNNLEIYEKVRSVPEEAKKKITGGRLNGMTDINPMWRIKSLTENFGVCGFGWKIDIVSEKLEKGCNDEISAFVKINLFVKVDNEWSEAIPGTGGASFVAKEKNGLYQSDECFKMAFTDAVSVSCKLLGMGADVYFEKDRTKYSKADNNVSSPDTDTPEHEQLANAVSEMKLAKSLDECVSIWKTHKKFQLHDVFILSKENKKKELSKLSK